MCEDGFLSFYTTFFCLASRKCLLLLKLYVIGIQMHRGLIMGSLNRVVRRGSLRPQGASGFYTFACWGVCSFSNGRRSTVGDISKVTVSRGCAM